jgi:CRISPR-associated RAMP protein, cmr4 family
MEAKLFRIRLVTNLHMGSGEANFNFIDNQVQRDPITEYPNMHPSGIKGALRQFFNGIEKDDHIFNEIKKDNKENKDNYVRKFFGSENNTKDDKKQGEVSFIEGKLLSIPVRSNKKSYFMGTTIEIIKEYVEFSKIFGKNTENLKEIEEELKKIEKKLSEKNRKICVIGSQEEGLLIESFENDEIVFYQEDDILNKVLGIKDIVILKEEIFKDEISRRLPVIARNYLENGVSKNLWYEEVVPRESVFYTGIVNSQNTEKFEDFCKKIEDNLIQMGANATIGYGFTKFEEVK